MALYGRCSSIMSDARFVPPPPPSAILRAPNSQFCAAALCTHPAKNAAVRRRLQRIRLRHSSSRQREMVHQQPDNLRALALFFVLEIDVDVAARGGFARDRIRPPPDIVRLIA